MGDWVMAWSMRRGFFIGALVFLFAWAVPPMPGSAQETFAKDRLTIVTAAGREYPFRVEIAETLQQRAQGLQGRRQMATDAGMLFDFGKAKPVIMWMKDTFIALDMIFIGPGGKIVNIVHETVPGSLSFIESAGPVLGVLEVRAKTAARLGIKKGDRVKHRIFE